MGTILCTEVDLINLNEHISALSHAQCIMQYSDSFLKRVMDWVPLQMSLTIVSHRK